MISLDKTPEEEPHVCICGEPDCDFDCDGEYDDIHEDDDFFAEDDDFDDDDDCDGETTVRLTLSNEVIGMILCLFGALGYQSGGGWLILIGALLLL